LRRRSRRCRRRRDGRPSRRVSCRPGRTGRYRRSGLGGSRSASRRRCGRRRNRRIGRRRRQRRRGGPRRSCQRRGHGLSWRWRIRGGGRGGGRDSGLGRQRDWCVRLRRDRCPCDRSNRNLGGRQAPRLCHAHRRRNGSAGARRRRRLSPSLQGIAQQRNRRKRLRRNLAEQNRPERLPSFRLEGELAVELELPFDFEETLESPLSFVRRTCRRRLRESQANQALEERCRPIEEREARNPKILDGLEILALRECFPPCFESRLPKVRCLPNGRDAVEQKTGGEDRSPDAHGNAGAAVRSRRPFVQEPGPHFPYGGNGISTFVQVRTGCPFLRAGSKVQYCMTVTAASSRSGRTPRATSTCIARPVSEIWTRRTTVPPILASRAARG